MKKPAGCSAMVSASATEALPLPDANAAPNAEPNVPLDPNAPGDGSVDAEPKAKAKAKVKAKAKPAGKGKAKSTKSPGVTSPAPKAKPKATSQSLKRPAAAPNTTSSTEPKAKAKGKAKTVKEMTQGWLKKRQEPEDQDDHAEGEEEEAFEDDEPQEEDHHRSYPKARKWARMIKAGQVPDDLQKLYEEGAKNSSTPRLFKSQFINKVFQKNSRGEYVLAPGSAESETFKKNSEIRSNSSLVTGLPYSIMLWTNFHGNEQALNDAERRGDIYQKDGFWHFKTVQTAIEKKQEGSMVVHGGRAELTLDEYSQMNQFMSSRPWSQFGKALAPPNAAPGVTASSSAMQKAICDAPQKLTWASVEEDIKEAKGAQERLQRECQRLAAKVSDKKDDKINETLKVVMQQLSQRECQLAQCIIFQSVEGTGMEKSKVENFFADLGQATEDANEKLESTKSIARTRGWLENK